MQRRKMPTHVRTFHGRWCKVTLDTGEIIVDKYESSRNHGLVMLREYGRIPAGSVRGFTTKVTPEDKNNAYSRK